jgi:hypothetical protein
MSRRINLAAPRIAQYLSVHRAASSGLIASTPSESLRQ